MRLSRLDSLAIPPSGRWKLIGGARAGLPSPGGSGHRADRAPSGAADHAGIIAPAWSRNLTPWHRRKALPRCAESAWKGFGGFELWLECTRKKRHTSERAGRPADGRTHTSSLTHTDTAIRRPIAVDCDEALLGYWPRPRPRPPRPTRTGLLCVAAPGCAVPCGACSAVLGICVARVHVRTCPMPTRKAKGFRSMETRPDASLCVKS